MSAKQTSLGRSIVKNHSKRKRFVAKEGHRHSSDLPDGRDWGRLNLHSVTQHTTLDDFLDRVQLADTEYNSEFHNIKIVSRDVANGMLSEGEKLSISDAQEKNKKLLCIPRRPAWDQTTTKEELDRNENESFLDWRRNLALLNEEEHINLTPYEKNLEVWRQLWRVIEKSDVVMQIIDSRNPLLFRCEDLETYVKEIDENKLNILLLNKADFLTLKQRQHWACYFSSIGVKVVFFSALQQMQNTDETSEQHDSEHEVEKDSQDSLQEEERLSCSTAEKSADNSVSHLCNTPSLLSREELIRFLKSLGGKNQRNSMTTIGLVGYPNVGKSSTINAVLHGKKVSVSATPGKTKHFQTLMVDPELCFCDCPGLVFPNFVSTKAEMVINGILPIDQLTSYIPPVTIMAGALHDRLPSLIGHSIVVIFSVIGSYPVAVVDIMATFLPIPNTSSASLIPKEVLESAYSITLPSPSEGQDPSRPPTAEELLNAHGYMRGFMTHRGLPDIARSARYILKDFVNGKLLYCHAPPDVKHEEYQEFSFASKPKPKRSGHSESQTVVSRYTNDVFDQKYFDEEEKKERASQEAKRSTGAHAKNQDHARRMITQDKSLKNTRLETETKAHKMHHNKNRKQKLRRIYSHLDQ